MRFVPGSFVVAAAVLTSGIASPLAAAAAVPDGSRVVPQPVLEVHVYSEGVVFDHQGHGYLSHGDRISKFTLDGQSDVWATTGAPNGHKVLADGTHLVCDGSQHAVLHLSADGKVLGKAASECDGKPLRAPNDLCLDPQGGFYFTDPGGSSAQQAIGTVHYVDPAGRTRLVAAGHAFPNGIVLAPDAKRLWVAESGRNRIIEFPLTAPGKAGEMKVFAELPAKGEGQVDNQPDGMCLDAEGNLYVAHYGMRQVQVLDPEGKLIARLPGGNLTTSNVAFGGPNLDQLFVTGGLALEKGRGGLFRLDLGKFDVTGLRILPERKPERPQR
ncbi:MAG: SMP-30/gluconolactonase/LRE family protein [Planctomycetales bacterium]